MIIKLLDDQIKLKKYINKYINLKFQLKNTNDEKGITLIQTIQ